MNRSGWMKTALLSVAVVMMVCFTGCGGAGGLKDGFYTAEMSGYSHGWEEYLIIQVKSGKIVSAEYNARNESGFIKAWDNTCMKNMLSRQGTYPNKYMREYVQQLIDDQADVDVDAVSGASHSGQNFERLVAAVLEQAAAGDSATVTVEYAEGVE